MTTNKNHIDNLVLKISRKIDNSEYQLIYCQTYLPKQSKSKIKNQYINKEYISMSEF